MIRITRKPIDILRLYATVNHASAGGVALFVGTTRENSHGKNVRWLEYEAYAGMALRTMEEIAVSAAAKWELIAVSMVHRTGKVPIGEASVAIGVAAEHREEAFAACRFMIDTLKKTVP